MSKNNPFVANRFMEAVRSHYGIPEDTLIHGAALSTELNRPASLTISVYPTPSDLRKIAELVEIAVENK